MECLEVFKQLGFGCFQLKSGSIEIETPLIFDDGEPVYLYLEKVGKSYLISDKGEFLFHLESTGLNVSDQRRVSYLTKSAKEFGIALSEKGAFETLTATQKLELSFGRFLEFIPSLLIWERESLLIDDEDGAAIDDVITILKRRNPRLSIETNPKPIEGGSGSKYSFDIKAGNTYIDVLNPHRNATGAALRKIADLSKATESPESFFVIDDRKGHDASHKESAIISSVASVILYTTLEHGTDPLTQLH
ncbi:DUF1828 domain-containing protein [Hydrogenovibrio sp. JE_KL2]|uniref:DUF1828 domain-containing protein n=1 Tax=Hydrogenovibrio sp. JE_KL2 TaxID=2651188 RepID=UPI001561F6F7|nr:DUF1828 domain-containing protein [Hydrogenovibrio sp. JE_KL2]